jgi:hypothetical protein
VEINNYNQPVPSNPQDIVTPPEVEIKQKGYFLPLLVAIVALIILGVGGFYFYQKQSKLVDYQQVSQSTNTTNTTTLKPPTDSKYQNTTKGIEISPSGKFIVCDYPNSDVKLGETTSCDLLKNSKDAIKVDTYNQFHQHFLSSVAPKTKQESLHNWVVKVADAERGETSEEIMGSTVTRTDNILDINPSTVLDEVTLKSTLNGSSTNSYKSVIYQEQGGNIIVLESGYPNTQGQHDDKLKSLLPLIQTIPVTTGDIGMNIIWVHNSNSGSYVNYTGNLYTADQKTVATNIKTDSQGQYFVRLKPGMYFFMYPSNSYPNGASKQIEVLLGKGIIPLLTININTEKDMFSIPAPSSASTQ